MECGCKLTLALTAEKQERSYVRRADLDSRNSEPIFPVADVVATVRYYRDVLGFAEE
jgi:hypothetical protein